MQIAIPFHLPAWLIGASAPVKVAPSVTTLTEADMAPPLSGGTFAGLCPDLAHEVEVGAVRWS